MITTGQKTVEEPNKMSIISRIRILRVIKGYNDYLTSINTSSAKGAIKKWVLLKNKHGKFIRLIKVLKILK